MYLNILVIETSLSDKSNIFTVHTIRIFVGLYMSLKTNKIKKNNKKKKNKNNPPPKKTPQKKKTTTTKNKTKINKHLLCRSQRATGKCFKFRCDLIEVCLFQVMIVDLSVSSYFFEATQKH